MSSSIFWVEFKNQNFYWWCKRKAEKDQSFSTRCRNFKAICSQRENIYLFLSFSNWNNHYALTWKISIFFWRYHLFYSAYIAKFFSFPFLINLQQHIPIHLSKKFKMLNKIILTRLTFLCWGQKVLKCNFEKISYVRHILTYEFNKEVNFLQKLDHWEIFQIFVEFTV